MPQLTAQAQQQPPPRQPAWRRPARAGSTDPWRGRAGLRWSVQALRCRSPGDPQRLGDDGLHRDVAEVLSLLPMCFTAAIELQERKDGDCDGHTIGARDGLIEGEAPSAQELAQVGEALDDADAGYKDVAQADGGRHAQQATDGFAKDSRVLLAVDRLLGGAPQVSWERRRAEAHAMLGGEELAQVPGRRAVAARVEHFGQQLLGGLIGFEVEQLLILAAEQ